ncbi:hypothetical protein CaldiYA01_04280 [Caldicellulosiruptor diazotrophicus]|uniref:Uncharacterized protein n=1 Tax=Caldicellulosiruptor diazotrophicus TaxID=2806205 RepID=A0ABN6E516_9FIRM|nr:hypothetical protein CaldiYA01_04280 [Caldicellulosiruptor diazotrophicus]
MFISTDATDTPRPICIGFEPPLPEDVSGADADFKTEANTEANVTLLDLNPTVFTLAMLSPITSILVW